MKIKVRETTNTQLDWLVEFALLTDRIPNAQQRRAIASRNRSVSEVGYSTDWSQGGPIIEREGLHLRKSGCEWQCNYWNEAKLNFDTSYGPTPLIAAMRCFVASRLGDEVEVPDELA